jgi:cysteine-rich repeat protein
VESGACVSDTRSCSAAYATAANQTWTGSAYGSCTATACASAYHIESGACVSDTRSCTIAYGSGSESWNGSSYDICTLTTCDSGYHATGNACDANVISCSLSNATAATQTWNSATTAYGTCTASACAATYHVESGACASDTRSCSIANGTGSQSWSGSAYGSCAPTSCNAGYRPFGSICIRTICGDSVVDSAEQCDDGNAVTEVCDYGLSSCDVCNATCQLESGVTTYCGNGVVDGSELCDDGDGSNTNGCTTSCVCSSGYHLESSTCVNDTRSCSAPNATAATQTWTGSAYGTCTATACASTYHVEGGACVSDTRSCTLANATAASQTWTGSGYGSCTATACASTYHIESGACVIDTRSCSLANATAATQTWTGSAYGTCTATACVSTYHVESGVCVSDTRSCTAANATAATESWTGTGYGVCTISACSAGFALVSNSCVGGCGNGVIGSGETCDDGNAVTEECAYGDLSCTVCNATCQTAAGETDFCTDGTLDPSEFCDDGNTSNADACNNSCACGSGYHAQGGTCASNVLACSINNGSGTETWNGSSYGVCTLTACNSGFHANGNACDPNVISCALANATAASRTWNGSTYGTCTATACASTYHIESGICVSDTRSCAIANGTGSQTYASGSWGTCSVVSCNSTYHIESGACASNTRTCSPLPANTTAGSQTWNSATSTYGSCTASACSSGYTVIAGTCVVSGYSLGTGCTLNSQCASGFCATGPDGTANDRCAPTDMNYIPAGTFSMGSASGEVGRAIDETQHNVTITRSFFIGQTEVTQGQWKALSGGFNPSCFQSTAGTACSTDNANDNGPVEKVDWFAAALYANAKSAAEGLTSCYTLTGCSDPTNGWKLGDPFGCADASFAGLSCTGYRLPTEAEWEYAARAGTTGATYIGSLSGSVSDCSTNQANLDGIAWWCRNAGSKARPAKGKAANNFGLYDMSGNVSEWVSDRFDTYGTGPATDPLGGTSTGTGYRAVRGGSWLWTAAAARSAARWGTYSPPESYPHLGFRLARTAP